jgi:hypothetical protein
LVSYLLITNNAFFLFRDEYIFTEKTTIIELRVPIYTLMMKLRNRTKLKTQSSSQISYRKTILLYKKIWPIWGTTNLTGKPPYYTNKSDRTEVRQILQENHLIIQKNLTDLRYDKSYRKTILLYKQIWPIWGTSNLTGKPSYYTKKPDRSEVRQILQENHLIIQKNLTDLRYDKLFCWNKILFVCLYICDK